MVINMELSSKARSVKESTTLRIAAMAAAMKADGLDIVSFSAGEPDFNTPLHVCQAAHEAIDEGFTRYTATSGIVELRKAVCQKLLKDNGLTYEPGEVVVSNGAKQALFNTFSALLNPGDEVLLLAPYWISYVEMVKIVGGVPVQVTTKAENGYKVTKEQLEAAMTPKTKVLVINSPCNPTGVVYGRQDLQMLADFAVAHDLFVISDEIYETLIFDDDLSHVSIASLGEDIFNRTVVINGLSKSHAMTGWRMGYSAAPAPISKVIGNIQSNMTANPNSVAQKAALAALTGSQDSVVEMCKAFKERQNYIYERIANLPGVKAVRPQGAFYVFADISALCGVTINGIAVESGSDVAQLFLQECHVALVPGADFGFEQCIRFSYSVSMDDIKKGLDRIEAFINKYYSIN